MPEGTPARGRSAHLYELEFLIVKPVSIIDDLLSLVNPFLEQVYLVYSKLCQLFIMNLEEPLSSQFSNHQIGPLCELYTYKRINLPRRWTVNNDTARKQHCNDT